MTSRDRRGPRRNVSFARLRSGHIAAFAATAALGATSLAHAQITPLNRLPASLLDAASPELRVSGEPGRIKVEESACTPRSDVSRRARIVDIAVQEWAFFGFHIVDQTGPPPPRRTGPWRPRAWMDFTESARVASSIAGYWSVTPDGGWIIDRQNTFWSGPMGVGARWRDPWSAAFISWTMCEAGIAPSAEFRRSINHRTYIDQAIRARDGADSGTAFIAYDVGERQIEPGDLLCSARRHGYRNLQDRRRHLGEGARTHCDIVVHVDVTTDRILAIGGNVRGRVSLKLLYASANPQDPQLHSAVGRGNRSIFAHLKLAEASQEAVGLLHTPSIRAVAEDTDRRAAIETALQIELPPVEIPAAQPRRLQEQS